MNNKFHIYQILDKWSRFYKYKKPENWGQIRCMFTLIGDDKFRGKNPTMIITNDVQYEWIKDKMANPQFYKYKIK